MRVHLGVVMMPCSLANKGLHVPYLQVLQVLENGHHFAKLLFHSAEERSLFHVIQELSLHLFLPTVTRKMLV